MKMRRFITLTYNSIYRNNAVANARADSCELHLGGNS